MRLLDDPKPMIFLLLTTLTVLLFWQTAGAADLESGRHSLIRRPQVHTTPILKSVPSPANPSSLTPPVTSSAPSQPLHRKIVRRPAIPSATVSQASPTVSTSAAQPDPSQAMSEHIPDDDPEPELEPISQESNQGQTPDN
jgi:hypothetical protein